MGFLERLEQVERTWLGWTYPPTRRVLAETRWAPDRECAYCGRCGASVGSGETTATGCSGCRGAPALADGVVRLGAYAGVLREWIVAIKYQGWAEMAEALGRRLGRAVAWRLWCPLNEESDRLGGAKIVVVPMPMPWQRRLYRGIDHARIIAGAAADELRAPCIQLLSKTNGIPQVAVPAAERPRRARGMHLRRLAGRLNLDDTVLVLIDDVRTSGASLRAAGRLLRRAQPRRMVAAVLAVADDRRRRSPGDPPRFTGDC